MREVVETYPLILFKYCGRCRGDMALVRSIRKDSFYDCVQCGNILELDEVKPELRYRSRELVTLATRARLS